MPSLSKSAALAAAAWAFACASTAAFAWSLSHCFKFFSVHFAFNNFVSFGVMDSDCWFCHYFTPYNVYVPAENDPAVKIKSILLIAEVVLIASIA
jgi:hypothetical protein